MSRTKRHFLFLAIALALVAAAAIGTYVASRQRRGLPSPGTDAYEQTIRHFYRGLAGLQVGLVDAARQEFVLASEHRARGAGSVGQPGPGLPATGRLRCRRPRGRTRAGPRTLVQPGCVPGGPSRNVARPARRRHCEPASRGGTGSSRSAGPHGSHPGGRERRRTGCGRRGAAAAGGTLRAATGQRGRARRARAAGREARPTSRCCRIRSLASARSWAHGRPRLSSATTRCSRRAGQGTRPMRRVRPPSCATCSRACRRFATAEPGSRKPRSSSLTPSHVSCAWRRRSRRRRLRTPRSRSRASPIGDAPTALWLALAVFSLDGDQRPVVFAADDRQVQRVDGPGPSLPIPDASAASPTAARSLVALDWNHDFRMDLVAAGPSGIRLFIQSADGSSWTRRLARQQRSGPVSVDATGAWAADIEMDGDLDIVVGVRAAAPMVLRNNGDGTWRSVQPFAGVDRYHAFAWGDLDFDGDPDAAMIDGAGALHVFANLQAGQFERLARAEARGRPRGWRSRWETSTPTACWTS